MSEMQASRVMLIGIHHDVNILQLNENKMEMVTYSMHKEMYITYVVLVITMYFITMTRTIRKSFLNIKK